MLRLTGRANRGRIVALNLIVLAWVSFATAKEPGPIQRMSFGPPISLDHIKYIPKLEPPPPPTETPFFVTYLRVHSTEELRRIADSHLAVGMRSDEVFDILSEYSIKAMNMGHSGVSMFAIYGTGRLDDPVLFVDFRRDAKRGYRVTHWSTEK